MSEDKSYKNIILCIITVVVLWLSITTTIQAFKCPSMTQTELFLNIPKTMVLNFKYNE